MSVFAYAAGWTPTDGGLVVDLQQGDRFLLSIWLDLDNNEKESPEDENPIGVIDTPVGEPWVLILLVGMYLFVTVRRKTKRITR